MSTHSNMRLQLQLYLFAVLRFTSFVRTKQTRATTRNRERGSENLSLSLTKATNGVHSWPTSGKGNFERKTLHRLIFFSADFSSYAIKSFVWNFNCWKWMWANVIINGSVCPLWLANSLLTVCFYLVYTTLIVSYVFIGNCVCFLASYQISFVSIAFSLFVPFLRCHRLCLVISTCAIKCGDEKRTVQM